VQWCRGMVGGRAVTRDLRRYSQKPGRSRPPHYGSALIEVPAVTAGLEGGGAGVNAAARSALPHRWDASSFSSSGPLPNLVWPRPGRPTRRRSSSFPLNRETPWRPPCWRPAATGVRDPVGRRPLLPPRRTAHRVGRAACVASVRYGPRGAEKGGVRRSRNLRHRGVAPRRLAVRTTKIGMVQSGRFFSAWYVWDFRPLVYMAEAGLRAADPPGSTTRQNAFRGPSGRRSGVMSGSSPPVTHQRRVSTPPRRNRRSG